MLEDVRAQVLEDKTYELIQEQAEISEHEPPSDEQAPGKSLRKNNQDACTNSGGTNESGERSYDILLETS